MEKTKEFMLLFRFKPDFDHQPTTEELSVQHQLWGSYIGNLAMQEKLVSTHQLGFDGRILDSDTGVSEGIHLSAGETIGGNLVVRANGIDQAVEIGKDCPILAMGGSVEVREILEME